MPETHEHNTTIAPTLFIIFGITGDLSRKKILPALVHLEAIGALPERLRVIGFSRRDFTANSFAEFVRAALDEHVSNYTDAVVDRFCARLEYCPGTFENPEDYKKLGEKVYALEQEMFGTCANKLYYLATSPTFYEVIFENLANSGLSLPCADGSGWARILVEKPFGSDVHSARHLDELLGKLFKEEQIFRIDHYLAKEAVQNLIMFRFSNALFEPTWSREHVHDVHIRLLETVGIEKRGAFYDEIGAMRDVGQNHLLQMLGIIAMEEPMSFRAEEVRQNRAAVFRVLTAGKQKTGAPVFRRGQYQSYRDESGVADDSTTETWFALTAEVDNDRWRGVPFYLESGKALVERKTEIVVTLKQPKRCLSCESVAVCEHYNTLTFRIQPDEGITLGFWIKKPGLGRELERKELSFSYADAGAAATEDANNTPQSARLPDAYERLLFDAMLGDQTLFASTDEVMAAWEFIMPILDAREEVELEMYEEGSTGPSG